MTVDQRIITIFGGTGQQGSSVGRSLLLNKNKRFLVRVVTRNPSSEKAQALAALGAELVKADAFMEGEIEAAFRDSWAVFINNDSGNPVLNTDTFPTNYDIEATIIDAAHRAGVQHVVYSSGQSICAATKGRVHQEGFETKYHVEQYARTKPFTSFTAVLPAAFWENFRDDNFCYGLGGFPFYRTQDGTLQLRAPLYGGKEDMPWLSVKDDFGDIVHGIFLDPQQYNGMTIQAFSQQLSFAEMAQSFTDGTGQKCRYVQLASWRDIPSNNTNCRKEFREFLFYTFSCGGKFYGLTPTDDTHSVILKKAAKQAQGFHDGHLTTFKDWIAREWAENQEGNT